MIASLVETTDFSDGTDWQNLVVNSDTSTAPTDALTEQPLKKRRYEVQAHQLSGSLNLGSHGAFYLSHYRRIDEKLPLT